MKNKKLKKRLIIIGVCLVLVIGIAVGVVLLNQNSPDTGTAGVTRKCRNILEAKLSRETGRNV